MPITKEQAIAELERRKNPTSTSIPISKELAIAELQRRRMSGTQKQPTFLNKGISAGQEILDNPVFQTVLGAINPTASLMTSTQPARKFTGNAVSSALFNVPKVVPEIREALRPNNMSEGIATGAGQLAGAVMPFGAPAKLVGAVERGITSKVANKALAKGLGYAGAGATMGALETPEDTSKFLDIKQRGKQAAVGGALGVALPAAIGGVSGITRATGNILKEAPKKFLNEILGTIPKADIKYNHNPMRGILKEKIISQDILGVDDLLDKVSTRADEIGSQLDNEYTNIKGTFDFREAVLEPIRNAYKSISKFPNVRAAQATQLNNIMADFKSIPLNNISAKEAWMLSRDIRTDLAKFRGTTADDNLVNTVFQDISRSLTSKIKEIEPKIKELSQTYGDLLSAENLLSNQVRLSGSRQILSPSAKAAGGLATALTGEGLSLGSIIKGIQAAGVVKVLQTPYLKTRLANALNSAKVQEIAEIMSKSPKFTDLFNSVYGTAAKSPQEVKAVVAEIVPEGMPTGFSRGNMAQQTQKALPAPEYQYLAGQGGTVRNIKPSDIGARNIASFTPDEWKAQLGNRYTPEQMRQHVLRGKREIVDRIKNGKQFDQSWLKKYPDIKRIADKLSSQKKTNFPMKKASVWADESNKENVFDYSNVNWTKVNSYLKRKGYDVRGADDVKSIYKRMTNDFTKNTSGEHLEALNYSITKKAQTVEEKALRYFGTTDNLKVGGYITPNGKIIDFSGYKFGGNKYDRSLDHRQIHEAFNNLKDVKLEELEKANLHSNSNSMIYFMNRGNIRLQSNGVDISIKPTQQQYNLLRKHILENKEDGFYVDISDAKGNTIKTFEYDFPQVSKVINDINSFFEKPTNKSAMAVPAGYAAMGAISAATLKKIREQREKRK